MKSKLNDCCCGWTDGTNPECERCQLLKEIATLRAINADLNERLEKETHVRNGITEAAS